MVFLGIFLLIVTAFILFLLWIFNRESEDVIPCAALGAVCLLFLFGGGAMLQKYFDPAIKPMDVYRGRTTLEITYRDSVAIDSVVIWKEEVK